MARQRWAGSGQPVDDQLAEADIQDRLQLANALRQKAMGGAQLDNVGGHLIGSPWARALTGVAQGIQGEGEKKRAYGMAGELAASKRERLAKALGGAGQDQTPDGMIEFGTRLLQDPATSEVGQFYINAGQKAKDRAAAREAEQARWGHQDKVTEDNFRRGQEGADARAQRAIEAANARAAAKGGAGGDADPYFTTQQGALPDGTPIMVVTNARDGTSKAMTLDGQPVSPAGQTPKLQGEIAGAKQMGKADADYWASRPAAKASRESLLADLRALRDAPGFESIFGAVGGRIPNVMPEARDARAQLAKVVGGMSLKNRDLLEGQGAVSNFEGELLSKAATILSDTSISDELAAAEVTKILDDLQTGKYAPAAPSSALPQQPGAAPPAAPPAAGGLSPEEQAELDQLRQHFRGGATP